MKANSNNTNSAKHNSLFAKKLIYVVLANIIIAFGIALLHLANVGTDPYTCMNLGVSSHLPISYGTYQLLLNIVLFIPLVILKPRIFGVGAIVNMFGIGYFVEFFSFLAGLIGITIDSLLTNIPIRVVFLIIGVTLICYGAALYMECNMGTSSYDSLAMVIDEKTNGKLKFKWVRICTDVFCIIIGFISGSVVGIGTIIVGFFTGPLVSFFRSKIKFNKQ